MILALDLGTKTGFATSRGEVNTIDMTNAKCKLTALRGFILKVHANEPITLIAVEQASMGAFHGGKKVRFGAMAFFDGMLAIVKQLATEIGAMVLEINPLTLKKFATGSGRAKKPDMIRACALQFGLQNLTGDEADARMALAYAEQWLKRPEEFRTKKQRNQVARKVAKKQARLW